MYCLIPNYELLFLNHDVILVFKVLLTVGFKVYLVKSKSILGVCNV